MKFSMRFEGGTELARVLNEMPSRVSKAVLREALLKAGAPPIRSLAASLAPRDPGAPDIADHIVVSVARGDRSAAGAAGSNAAVAIGPSTEPRSDQPRMTYARQGKYLELGTSDTKMQPFMRPAFDQAAPGTLRPIAAAMWHAIVARGFSTRGSSSGGGLL